MTLTKKNWIAVAVTTVLLLIVISIFLFWNHQRNAKTVTSAPVNSTPAAEKAEVLPYLNMQQSKANYALPFCEKKNCIDLDVQTIQTQDQWLNTWIAKNQAHVIQQQIGQNQNLNLQQAIDAYVKKSDVWQEKYSKNKAYELHLDTRIASQRNQYVLLQIGVDTTQEELAVKDRF